MSRLIVSTAAPSSPRAAAGASTLVLAGCDQFDFLGQRDRPGARLPRARQHADLSGAARARRRADAGARPIRERDPAGAAARTARPIPTERRISVALRRTSFADYRLKITGLVERELSFSLDELRNMPARSADHAARLRRGLELHCQMDRHAGSAQCSTRPEVKPAARFCVYHCYDVMGGGLSGAGALLRELGPDRRLPPADDPGLRAQRRHPASRERRAGAAQDRAGARATSSPSTSTPSSWSTVSPPSARGRAVTGKTTVTTGTGASSGPLTFH